MEAQRSRLHQLPHHNGTSDHNRHRQQRPQPRTLPHTRRIQRIRHNREPGLHTSTIANTATITPIRNGFNANGTRTFARTASNGISEPFGSTIRTHTEPPAAAACTYSERGEDTDTELTVPALRLTSGRTRTVRNTCSDCLAALSTPSKTPDPYEHIPTSHPHRPAYMPASDR